MTGKNECIRIPSCQFGSRWLVSPNRRAARSSFFALLLTFLIVMGAGPQMWAKERVAPRSSESKLSPDQLAAWIDQRFRAAWNRQGIEPAPRTTDSEYVRRAFLDLIGRIPSVAEAREFLDDTASDKRLKLVEELLQRGAFANHLANTWRDQLLAGSTAQDNGATTPSLDIWLKLRFTANMPYDQVVSELLTAPLDRNVSPRTPSPIAFYQAAEFKPEQLAANASRVFMGIQVQCAQCHDHPFAEWKQPQFWSFAAFFDNLENRTDDTLMRLTDASDEIKIPGKDILVPAAFLDGSKPVRTSNETRRVMLARWITNPANPYFAKAAVNRIWGSYLGHGFVQPVDDLDPSHPASYPEIFDALCTQFRLHHYDLKYVIRVIAATEVYQLSCRGAPATGEDQLSLNFARMPLRRMTNDQIYASFVQATGFRDAGNPNAGDTLAQNEFREKFADSAVSPTEIKTTILQALSLMNGRHVTLATDIEKSEFLSVVADAPYLDAAGRVEALFLAALSRSPEPDELQFFVDEQNSAESKRALADLFWMLLNSAEFLINH